MKRKFTNNDKIKAIKMHKNGMSADKIFKELFPEIDASKYQKSYAVKKISDWKRKRNTCIIEEGSRFRELKEELKLFEAKVALLEKESVFFQLLRKEEKLTKNKEKKFKVIYEIRKEKPEISLKILLEIYSLSSSGYYKFVKEKDQRWKKDFNLFTQINDIFLKSKKTKGYRQISMMLGINHKKAYRIMRKYNLRAEIRKVNNAAVRLKKNREDRFVPNILNREFKQELPYTHASTDITYLKHQGRFSFLSVVKDLASGEILSYKFSAGMNLKLVLDTVEELVSHFNENNLDLSKLLLHSDQGFQYTNLEYHNRMKELGITQSMSRKGNSVDNAPIESFFGHMKDEVEYGDLSFKQLNDLIDKYMLEYNQQRKQWIKKKMTPVCYREYLLNKSFAI